MGASPSFLITKPAGSLSTKNVSSGTTVSGHSTVRASSTVWHVARIIGASPTLQPRQRRQVASRLCIMRTHPQANPRAPFSMRQAVTPANFRCSEPLVDIAFLPRSPHPHEAARHTSKAPNGAFLLCGQCRGPTDPSECWKDEGAKGWIHGGTGAVYRASFPLPYLARPRAGSRPLLCAPHSKMLPYALRA
jgi:hypothetical protein